MAVDVLPKPSEESAELAALHLGQDLRPFPDGGVVRSGEEEAVRGLFNDHVLEYYEAHPNVCTEACGDELVYYRAQKRLDPAEVRSFLEEGFRVLALFRPPKEAT